MNDKPHNKTQDRVQNTIPSGNSLGLFEIHIAGPKTEVSVAHRVFDDLRAAGLTKNKFFLGVYNVPTDGRHAQVPSTPPTGHDLSNPGWMTTITTSDFEKAKRYVLAGMQVLGSHHLKGNFEIERVISENIPNYHIIVESEFPEYQRVHDSPEFENHLIWKDSAADLPSNKLICDVIQERLGIMPHQIVDFSRDPSGESLVSRVATIYQPSRAEALRFGTQLGTDEKLAGHKYLVTEQVCLVGELKSR